MADEIHHRPGVLTKITDVTLQFLRPLNFVFGGLTIFCGVYNLILSFDLTFGFVFRSLLSMVFTSFLGLLILAGDIPRLGFIQHSCRFLLMTMGRGIFNIFVGAWVYSLGLMRLFTFPSIMCWVTFIVIYLMSLRQHSNRFFTLLGSAFSWRSVYCFPYHRR